MTHSVTGSSSSPTPALVRPRARPAWLTAGAILQRAAMNFNEDRGTHMAAAIAYYGLFSLFPLVTLAVSIFGIVMRDDQRRARVVQALVDALPVSTSGVADSLFAVASRGPTLTLVAAAATIWAASALLSVVRASLAVAFAADRGVPPLRAKAVDLIIAPIAGAAFLLSLTVTTSWRVLQSLAAVRLPFLEEFGWAWDLGAELLPPTMVFLGFLAAYRVLPGRAVPIRYLWGGALVATAGFELVKAGFALYIANFGHYDVVYGSLGGVVALLFWVYLSANMLLIGAEVAAETAHVLRGEPRHGRHHPPELDREWRSAVWAFLVGLVLAPGKNAGPGPREEERLDAPPASEEEGRIAELPSRRRAR
ncbi:MAG: YihY/virulence factor BrkB family protein [Dehalococcoidia bacterium]